MRFDQIFLRSLPYLTVAAFAALSSAAAPVPDDGVGSFQDPTVQALTLKVAGLMESWSSIEIQCIDSSVSTVADVKGRVDANRHYIETKSGKRYANYMMNAKGRAESRSGEQGVTGRQEGFCDGKRCAYLMYRSDNLEHADSMTIGPSFMKEASMGNSERPIPLRMMYVGKTPLYEMMKSGIYKGSPKVLDRQVIELEFANVKWAGRQQRLIYSIDLDTGVPLKVEGHGLESGATEAPRWVWTAKSLKYFGTYPAVDSSETIAYDDRSRVRLRTSHLVSALSINKEYEAALFWPKDQPRAIVFDKLKKTTFIPDSRRANADYRSAAVSPPGLRVVRPRDWSHYASRVCLGLGIALVLVAFVARIKHARRENLY